MFLSGQGLLLCFKHFKIFTYSSPGILRPDDVINKACTKERARHTQAKNIRQNTNLWQLLEMECTVYPRTLSVAQDNGWDGPLCAE